MGVSESCQLIESAGVGVHPADLLQCSTLTSRGMRV